MSGTGRKIVNLLASNKPAAADMTSTIKDIGGGDMFNGVKTIFNYAMEEGNRNGYMKGHKDGTIKGVLITVGIGGAVLAVKTTVEKVAEYREKKQAHEKSGQKIYDAFVSAEHDIDEQDCGLVDESEIDVLEVSDEQK